MRGFPDECDKMKDNFNSTSVRVTRFDEDGSSFDNGLTEEQKKHISEVALNDYIFDFHISNISMGTFENQVKEFYKNIK